MARINTISDGSPITYELINTMIQEINKIKELPEDSNQNIVVRGPGLANNNNTAKIIAGREKITLGANDLALNKNIKFVNNGFSSDNPIVTASMVDADDEGGVQLANITITEVNKSNFTVKIKLLKARKKAVNFTVNYIAVGADSA